MLQATVKKLGALPLDASEVHLFEEAVQFILLQKWKNSHGL